MTDELTGFQNHGIRLAMIVVRQLNGLAASANNSNCAVGDPVDIVANCK